MVNGAKVFIPVAVQDSDHLAVFHAQDTQRVMRFLSGKPQRGPGAMFWRQIKAVHFDLRYQIYD